MAVPANTVQTFATVGIREDLSDIMLNIAPRQTPFFSTLTRKSRAMNRTPEWLKDTLRAATVDNKVIEGDAAEAAKELVRLLSEEEKAI